MTPAEFSYRARFAARSYTPGAHASRVRGSGLDVAAVVPIERARDLRRLDLHAALRDPHERWWVREHHQRSSIAVRLLADVSASVAASQADRRALTINFAQALRHSVARTGDAFALHAFAAQPLQAAVASRARGLAAAAVAQLAARPFDQPGAAGVLAVADALPREPSLVFLVSDFHWPVALLDDALARLARHDVVPVWLAEPPLAERLPTFGLLALRDAETGAERTVWMRPALRKRWTQAQAHHEAQMRACFERHQRVPLELSGAFGADAVSDYFAARG
jgi:hypothetical protein